MLYTSDAARVRTVQDTYIWCYIRKRALRKPDLQENRKLGSRYTDIGVERTRRQLRDPAWISFPVLSLLLGVLYDMGWKISGTLRRIY